MCDGRERERRILNSTPETLSTHISRAGGILFIASDEKLKQKFRFEAEVRENY